MMMFLQKRICLVTATLLGMGLFSCDSSKKLDNPVRGSIRIAADESFKPVIEELTHGYEAIYPETHFDVSYISEQEAIIELLKDSVRMVFVTRELTQNERDAIEAKQSVVKVQSVATDGIALIAAKQNPDSLITMQDLHDLFSGKIVNWDQIRSSRQTGLVTLVFDGANSSNLSFIKSKFKIKDFNNIKIYAAGSNQKVIEYVKNNPLAIGFIGVNWISDGKDLLARDLSKGIRVFGVSNQTNPDSMSSYFQPFYHSLRYEDYPLSRKLFIISREGYSGLGGGLMTYIARDVGGLIIQKKGLVPDVLYPRTIEVQHGQKF